MQVNGQLCKDSTVSDPSSDFKYVKSFHITEFHLPFFSTLSSFEPRAALMGALAFGFVMLLFISLMLLMCWFVKLQQAQH